jgi:hypothetical protein
LPLLVDRPGGLLVEVTDGTSGYNASHYRSSVFYDLAKVAVNRLAFSQGHELVGRAVAAVAADAKRQRHNQRSLSSGQLAAEYAFTDIDGSRPDIWRYLQESELGRAGPLDSYR